MAVPLQCTSWPLASPIKGGWCMLRPRAGPLFRLITPPGSPLRVVTACPSCPIFRPLVAEKIDLYPADSLPEVS